jgi:hypothetical protein
MAKTKIVLSVKHPSIWDYFFFFLSLAMFIFFGEVVDPLSQSRYFFPFSVRKQPSLSCRKKMLSGFYFCRFSFLSFLSLTHIKLLTVLSYCSYRRGRRALSLLYAYNQIYSLSHSLLTWSDTNLSYILINYL